MSKPFNCHCPERKKPIQQRAWVVTQRRCHHSAFSGYHRTPSDYSTVHCLVCGACGRTRASYVECLRDATEEDLVGDQVVTWAR